MRTLSVAILVLLISGRSFGQGQTNVPPAVPHVPKPKDQLGQVNAPSPPHLEPRTDAAVSEEWFTAQSDQLLQTLECFLDKQSIENQRKAESKNDLSPPAVLAARVKLLAALVQKNSRNHCK